MIQSLFKKFFSSQLRLNMLSGSVSMGLGIVVSAVKYPLYLHFLGYEHYGAWLLLSIILTFAQIGLLGLEPAITKVVAEEYGKSNHRAIQEYLITSLCMLLVIGLILLSIAIVFKWQILRLMGLEGNNAALVGGLLTYMVIFSIGVLAYQILNSVLAGVGRIDLANYSQTALQILPLLMSIPLLMADKGVVSLLLANAFAYVFIFSFNLTKLHWIVRVNILDITSFSWRRFHRMAAFGGTIFAGSILNIMVVPVTKIVITRSIGIEVLPVFELTFRVGMQVRSIFEVAFRALMPEISKLSSDESQKNSTKLKRIISKAYCLFFLGAIPLYMLAFSLAGLIFETWLGENFVPSIPSVFRVFLFATFISLFGLIKYYTFIGLGFVNSIFLAHVLKAIGTLSAIGVINYCYPVITIHSIAWCFVIGSFCSTTWLLLYKKNQKKALNI